MAIRSGLRFPAKVQNRQSVSTMPRSWVIVSEHNIDEWPNAGSFTGSGEALAWFGYGFHSTRPVRANQSQGSSNWLDRKTKQRGAPLIA